MDDLQELLGVAEKKILFFDSCTLEQFPPALDRHVLSMINAVAAGEPVPKAVVESIDETSNVAHRVLNYILDAFEIESYDVIKKYFGAQLAQFFSHDAAHLADTLFTLRDKFGTTMKYGFLEHQMKLDPAFYPDVLGDINTFVGNIAKMYAHPWRLIHYLGKEKLGEPAKYTLVSPQKHFEDVAKVLSFRFGARVNTELGVSTPLKKSISMVGHDVPFYADEGLVWSIVYNNLKNAQKKFEQKAVNYVQSKRGLGQSSEKTNELFEEYIQQLDTEETTVMGCYEVADEYVALLFTDSGDPLSLDTMVDNIRKAMNYRDSDNFDWISDEAKQRFQAWSKNDYAFNLLTSEDISGVAFMANMSGAGINSITSGLGLYGTRHIVESLGGAILYSTSFDRGNPIFAYILPKNVSRNKFSDSKSIRKSVVLGEVALPCPSFM